MITLWHRSIAIMLLFATILLSDHSASLGQDADPTDILPEGVTIDYLAQAAPEITPGPGLAQFRITLAVDAAVPAWYLPGMAVVTIESGGIHVAAVKGPLTVVNPGRTGKPDRVDHLAYDPNQTGGDGGATLLAGDFLFAEQGGVIRVKQERHDPAVLMVATVVQPGEPLIRFTADPRAAEAPNS